MGSWCSWQGSYGNGFDNTKLRGLDLFLSLASEGLSLFPRSLVVDQNGRVDAQGVCQALEIGQINGVGLASFQTRYGGLWHPRPAGELGLGPPLGIPKFFDAEVNRCHGNQSIPSSIERILR